MRRIISLYKKCKKSDSSFILVLIRLLTTRLFYGKTMLIHQHAEIKGLKNIEVKGVLEIGIGYVGFAHRLDKTYLNINGKLKINGNYSIERGCRLDIGENAVVTIGKGGYINCNTNLIIMHKLVIGDNCSISWNCQFLDEDFHEVSYLGKQTNDPSIIIGNHVWIGCGVKIYKGTVIPNGCVIASDSIVKGIFHVENALIGGSPARVIKENVDWK
ncbi:MAG: acyltransferase [bacterium]|nr:acyltransferase [bacterium]